MQLPAVWIPAACWILNICRAHASLPEPVLLVEENIMLDESAVITCTLNVTEALEVELKIPNLTSCVQDPGPPPKLTCEQEIPIELHGTELTCEAHFVTKSKPEKINIMKEPEFTDCPTTVTWVEGETTSFHCKAVGYPTPEVKCTRDNASYKEEQPIVPSRNLSGKYSCRAKNKVDATLQMVTVSVQYKPKILRFEAVPRSPVAEGENVTLHCEAEGLPSPTYSWESPVPGLKFSPDNRTAWIQSVARRHVARYTCKAQNKHGVDTRVQEITLAGNSRAEKTQPKWGTIFFTLISSSLIYLVC